MVAITNICTLALAATATAATVGYTTISDCFTLKGINPNGTSLGVLNVANYAFSPYYVYGVFGAPATKLGIDARTRHLLDRSVGDVVPNVPHKGLTASATKSGVGSSNVWFDTKNTTVDPGATGRVALNCQIDATSRLTCAHPNKRGYNVFHFCPPPAGISDIFPALRIGAAGDIATAGFFGETCYAITVVATRAQGCLV